MRSRVIAAIITAAVLAGPGAHAAQAGPILDKLKSLAQSSKDHLINGAHAAKCAAKHLLNKPC